MSVAFRLPDQRCPAGDAAGVAAGWGFQLQQPGFVAALVLLMFAVGLLATSPARTGSMLP